MSSILPSLDQRKARAHHILSKSTRLDPEETRDAFALICGLRGVAVVDKRDNRIPMNRLGWMYRRLELERIDSFLLHTFAIRIHPDWFQLPLTLMQHTKPLRKLSA